MLASFWTSPLEPGPVRSGPILREHQMGGKGPRTRSIENFRTRQTSCRFRDANRENRQDFRVAHSKNKGRRCKRVTSPGRTRIARAPQKIACAKPATVTSSETHEQLRAFTKLRACSCCGRSVCSVFLYT